jgi:hypothetical protein
VRSTEADAANSGPNQRSANEWQGLSRRSQPNRTLSGRWIDHDPTLRDLQFTAGDHAACGSAGRLHQVAPFLAADGSRRVRRADRGIVRPGLEQRYDRRFELLVDCIYAV